MGDHIGRNMPPKPPKMGVNRQFLAKTANTKIANRKISKTINRPKTKFEEQIQLRPKAETENHFVSGPTLPTSNPIWLPAAILKKMDITS